MDPLTHALASFALARAGLNRVVPRATPMLLVSGLAADLDWLTYPAGAGTFLAAHRTGSDSLVGAAAIALTTAGCFWLIGQRSKANPVRLTSALPICCAGAGLHLLLDLTNSYGVKLLWPFTQRWYAWNLANSLDPWLLALLVSGLLLPSLFGLVSAEIGAKPKRSGVDRGIIAVLFLIVLYFGARDVLHERARALLNSRQYREEEPLRVEAFPTWSLLDWSGVVETDDALAEIDVPLSPSGAFDPEKALIRFKPMESQVLDRARQTSAAQAFLSFARFPLVTVERGNQGYGVQIHDLRFAAGLPGEREIVALVDLNAQSNVTADRLEFEAADRNRLP